MKVVVDSDMVDKRKKITRLNAIKCNFQTYPTLKIGK
jgi:hypothetical protein